jgi:hypothetical protein
LEHTSAKRLRMLRIYQRKVSAIAFKNAVNAAKKLVEEILSTPKLQ